DVQLAQDLLHVVLHRERADLEDGADLEVRLAEVDPLQDVLLARGEHALARGLVERARVPLRLRARPGGVHRGNDELRKAGLARRDAARPAGEDEQAEGAPVAVGEAVDEELGRAQALDLAREAAVADQVALRARPALEGEGLVAPLLPR